MAKAEDYLKNYAATGDKVPQIAGLAMVLGITRETVRDWSNDPAKPEFSAIVKRILAGQERALANGGLDGTFQQKTVGLMMSKHGYRDHDDERPPAAPQITYNVFQIPEVKVAVLQLEKELKQVLASAHVQHIQEEGAAE